MPHSTGGGGSHGGSHSSSGSHSSHGGSGSGSSTHYYHDYAPGRHVWVTYGSGRPVIRYTDTRYSKPHPVVTLITVIIVAVIFMLPGIGAVVAGLPPARVTRGQTPLVIEDDADIFTDEEENALQQSVTRYYEKSGIPVVMLTVDFQTWYDEHGSWRQSQEDYAYDAYIGMFGSDETKWLLVIWNGELKYDGTYDLDAYSFEGMAGDDTSRMLTETMTDRFNATVSLKLGYGASCAEAFEAGFDGLDAAGASTGAIVYGMVWLAVAAAILVLAGILPFVKAIKVPVSQREHEVDTKGKAPSLVSCPYCGGTYVFGEVSCPHCGAPGRTEM